MLPDLEKIIKADENGRDAVAQAQQAGLALKSQADARVREIEARLQEELAQVRQEAQTEILQEAETRAAAIAAATQSQVQELTRQHETRREEALALLVARVLEP